MRVKSNQSNLKRFALPTEPRKDATITLSRSEQKHMAVRRIEEGEKVEVISPDGSKWLGIVEKTKPAKVRIIKLLSEKLSHNLTICIAVPTANRASVMIDKCTELGVGRIIPIVCEKNIVVPKSSQALVERWERIALAAAKQSGANVPHILPVTTFSELARKHPKAIILLPESPRHLASYVRESMGSSLSVVVGPELGYTEDEIRIAKENGLSPANLGRNILRVETAAIASCAVYSSIVFE